MMLCHRRLIDDEQATQQRIFVSIGSASSGAEAAGVERSTRSDFLTPRASPLILSFSACLAENPGALKIAGFYARNARRILRNPRIIAMAHLPVSTLLHKNWLRS